MLISHIVYTMLALLAGGAGMDKCIAYRHKSRLHDMAVRYWFKLDETPVPNLLQLTAKWIIKVTAKMAISRRTSILLYILATVSFVSIANLLQVHFAGGNWKHGPNGDVWDLIPLPHVAVYLTVSMFDIITLVLMRRFLIKLVTASNAVAVSGICSYIFILIALMILCCGSIYHVNLMLVNNSVIGEREAQTELAISDYVEFGMNGIQTNRVAYGIIRSNKSSFLELLRELSEPVTISTNVLKPIKSAERERRIEYKFGSRVYHHVDNSYVYDVYQSAKLGLLLTGGYKCEWIDHVTTHFKPDKGREFIWQHDTFAPMQPWMFLLTGTLVIPALMLVLTLMFVLASKCILFVIRVVAMYYIDVVTERNPKEFIPFTMLASAADIMILLLKGLGEIFKYL